MLSRSGKSGQPCLVPQHSQYHLTSVRMAMIKKKKMLVRTWRIWNLCTLLAGKQNRAVHSSVVKNLPASAGDTGLIPKIPWKRAQQPTPVFLPGKSHGQRSLLGYSPQGCKKIGHDLATKQKQQSNIQWEILRRNMTWGTMGNLEKSPPLSLCGLNSFS